MSVVIDGTSGITFPDSSSQSAAAESGYPLKSWVNFNGTGTVAIRNDQGVSSITDNGTGNYTVTFDSALAAADHFVGGCAGQQPNSYMITMECVSTSTSSDAVETQSTNHAPWDAAFVSVSSAT